MNSDEVEKIKAICQRYVNAVENSDLSGLLGNFTEDATVTSPISGKQLARDFYDYVFRVTGDRKMTLKAIFVEASDTSKAAVNIAYTRSVEGKAPAIIDAVDIFELDEDRSRIAAVTIIYDTAPVRSDFDQPAKR